MKRLLVSSAWPCLRLAFAWCYANAKRKHDQSRLTVVFFILFICCAIAGPEPAPFILHTADGRNLSGPLRKLAPDGSIRLGGDRPILVSGPEVVNLRRAIPLPDYPKKNVVILTNGDRIPLDPEPVRLEEGRLFF